MAEIGKCIVRTLRSGVCNAKCGTAVKTLDGTCVLAGEEGVCAKIYLSDCKGRFGRRGTA